MRILQEFDTFSDKNVEMFKTEKKFNRAAGHNFFERLVIYIFKLKCFNLSDKDTVLRLKIKKFSD